MKNGINKLVWILLNSAWTLFSFVGGAWIGFLIIGIKSKEKKWIITAAVYFAVLWGAFIVVGATANEVAAAIYFLIILISIIHSFLANRKYLICRKVLLDINKDQIKKQKQNERDKIIKHYKVKNTAKSAPASETRKKPVERPPRSDNKSFDRQTYTPEPNNKKIDLNTCSESELAGLPGVSVVSAKRAIEYRNIRNGFSCKDEFYSIAGVKPHFVVQLEKIVVCEKNTAAGSEHNDKEKKGRILDI